MLCFCHVDGGLNRGVRVCCRNAGLKVVEPVGDAQTRSVEPVQHVNASRFWGITCRDMGRDPLFQVRLVGEMLCDDMTLPPIDASRPMK
jgi:hypothetical protein